VKRLDLKITSERDNPLLERREVEFKVSYEKTAPTRKEVIASLAAKLNAKEDLVVIEKMTTGFGTRMLLGNAKLYGNANSLKSVEYDYTLKRGKPRKGDNGKAKDDKAVEKEPEDKAGDKAGTEDKAGDKAGTEDKAGDKAGTEDMKDGEPDSPSGDGKET